MGAVERINIRIMLPGIVIWNSQYNIPTKKVIPKILPITILSFIFFSSRLKNSGTRAIHAKNPRLKLGYEKTRRIADIIGKINFLWIFIFRSIFCIYFHFRTDKDHFFQFWEILFYKFFLWKVLCRA